MRAARSALALALLSSLAHCRPLLTAYQAAQPPALDGLLADDCWRDASVTSPFLSAQGGTVEEQQTQVRVCYDATSLYIGIEAFDTLLQPALNMLHQVRALRTGRDADVFSDDCVEVFLAPTAESYYHFASNSATGTYEGRMADGAWNRDWQCAARRGEVSYVVEMAIPFAALSASAGDPWRANFTRARSADGHLSTWSGLQGAFHQPDAFGTLAFRPAGPALGPVSQSRRGRELVLSGKVQGGTEAETRLEAQLDTAGSQPVSSSGPGEHALGLPLPAEAMAAGRVRLSYTLRHGADVLLGSAAIPVPLSAASLSWALATRDASAEAYLNGVPVQLSGEPTELELTGGLNVLCVAARKAGDRPRVSPRLVPNGMPLRLRWLAASVEPGADWLTRLDPGRPPAEEDEGGLWATPGADRAYLACGLYVPARGPRLFPKLDTCTLPRGSRQLMRLYLQMPRDCPLGDYAMVVEAPSQVRIVASEPVGGSRPEITDRDAEAVDDRPMTAHRLGYQMLPGNGLDINLRWADAGGATMSYQPGITGGGSFDWRRLSVSVTAPAGARSVHPLVIKWQDRGITGTFWVDNLSLCAEGSQDNLLKMGSFDEPEWGGNSLLVAEGKDGGKCVKVVATPELAGRQQALWVDKEAVVPVEPRRRYVLSADVKCEDLGAEGTQGQAALLLEASSDLEPGDLPLYTYFEALGGAVREVPQRSTLRILPPLSNARPKRARICPCLYGASFADPLVAQAYADNCYASGITWTYGRADNSVVPHLLDRGHQVFLSIPWEPWHRPPGDKRDLREHPDLQAVDFSGKPVADVYCPTWLLSEGEAVLGHLESWIVGMLNAAPYPAANWDIEQPVVDPPTFCTCERCRQAFAAFAQLPADAQVDAESILKQYRQQWTDFRCEQNAQMAGKMRAMVRKAERLVEFSVYSGYQGQVTKEHYGVDWSRLAPHLDFAIAGYNGDRRAVQATVEALGETPFMGGEMWYLSDTSDAQAPPRMETWCNRLLRQYMESGGNGCLIWWLPPMDGGAFYATSRAAEFIARYEGYLSEGRRCDAKVRVMGIDPTCWAAFEKDGRILVVTLNFTGQPLMATVTAAGNRAPIHVEPFGYVATVLQGP